MKAANDGFEATLVPMRHALADLRQQAPSFDTRVAAQTARVEKFVQDVSEVRRLGTANQNAEAIALVHSVIDPTFAVMVQEGNKLGEDITAAMDQGSAELTVRTDATRHTLILFSTLGMVAGLLAAAFVGVLGITRPLASLVGVLERMAQGSIEATIPEARRGDEIGAIGRAVEGIKAMVAVKAAEQAEMKRIADAAAALERKRTMVELADSFERAVGGIVGMVSSSATELQATAQQMTTTAGDTASQSVTVAGAAEEAAALAHRVDMCAPYVERAVTVVAGAVGSDALSEARGRGQAEGQSEGNGDLGAMGHNRSSYLFMRARMHLA
mgnify:CR=1 FL=1